MSSPPRASGYFRTGYAQDFALVESRLPPLGVRPEVPFVDTPDPAVRVITLGKPSAARFTAPQCNS